jgi:hypothetical protein
MLATASPAESSRSRLESPSGSAEPGVTEASVIAVAAAAPRMKLRRDTSAGSDMGRL